MFAKSRKSRPFVVCGLPRSRTAWLASFLSVPPFICRHEASAYFKRLSDLRELLGSPNTGISDTMIALLHREIRTIEPATRFVVVRRPFADVVASIKKQGCDPDLGLLARIDIALDELCEFPDVLEVSFSALSQRETACAVFRHCLDVDLDDGWWNIWGSVKVEADRLSVLAAVAENTNAIRSIYGPKLL